MHNNVDIGEYLPYLITPVTQTVKGLKELELSHLESQ